MLISSRATKTDSVTTKASNNKSRCLYWAIYKSRENTSSQSTTYRATIYNTRWWAYYWRAIATLEGSLLKYSYFNPHNT